MLGLMFIGVVFSGVFSQDLIGVNYSFDVDFERIFNNKSCDNQDNWNLVEYSELKISSPYNSQKGIRSRKDSCITSFPIVFFDSSFLELNIFLDVKAEESGLRISVFDENGISEVEYWYGKSNSNHKLGWSTISIAVHSNLTGYINLIGHSQEHEMVIVDSFQYIASPTVNRISDNTSNIAFYETDDLLQNVHEELDLLLDHEGSGEVGSGEEYDLQLGDELNEEDDLDEKGVTKIEE